MVKDILILQKREIERRKGEPFIDRDVIKHLKGMLSNDLIKVITGPRRAGKSCLGINLLFSVGNFGYVNFDDEKLIDIKDYDAIITAINSVYENPKYILFDEIQNLPKWELFVNRLQRQGYNLVITGSNSKLLSSELSPHLTGRHISVTIFPFSFSEFLKLERKELTSQEIKDKLLDYIKNGGYPEPLIKKIDHKEYLSTLFNSIIYKDIVKRFKIRLIPAVENLAIFLLSNTGKEFSYNTLSRITKCKSVHTVEKYLNYLEESFIFFRIHRFSPEKDLTSNKKIYCTDNGFIQFAGNARADVETLFENIVAIKLKKEQLNGGPLVYYWKHPLQQEVNFVLKKGTEVIQLIQVSSTKEEIKSMEKKERALIKAGKELNCDNLLIITDDYEGEKEMEWFGIKKRIRYIPLWKYLLESVNSC